MTVPTLYQNDLGYFGSVSQSWSGYDGSGNIAIFDFSVQPFVGKLDNVDGLYIDNTGCNFQLLVTAQGSPINFVVQSGEIVTLPVVALKNPKITVSVQGVNNLVRASGVTNIQFTGWGLSFSRPSTNGLTVPPSAVARGGTVSVGSSNTGLFGEGFFSSGFAILNTGTNSANLSFGNFGDGFLPVSFTQLAPGATFFSTSLSFAPPGGVYALCPTGSTTLVYSGV